MGTRRRTCSAWSPTATNAEAARALSIGEATVKTHLVHAFTKLGVDDRTAAVTVARHRGELQD